MGFHNIEKKVPGIDAIDSLNGTHLQSPVARRVLVDASPVSQKLDLLPLLDRSQASNFIDDQGRLCVRTRNNTLLPARQFWEGLEVNQVAIDSMVDADGKLLLQISDEEVNAIFSLPPSEAAEKMADALRIFYENTQKPLNHSVQRQRNGRQLGGDGMNRHGDEHGRKVTRDGMRDLANAARFRTDIGIRDFYQAAKALPSHDIGQVLQETHKTDQEQNTIFLLENVIPALTKDSDWDMVKLAILVHPEAVLQYLIDDVWHTTDNSAETIQHFEDDFPVVALALIGADKFHINQTRLPDIWEDPNGLLRDWHIAFNAAYSLVPERTGLSEDGTSYRATFTYNHTIEQPYLKYVRPLASPIDHPAVKPSTHFPEEGQWAIPEAIDRYLKDGVASHSEVFRAMMLSDHGYAFRLAIGMMAKLALSPTAKTFELVFSNPDAWKGLQGILPDDHITRIAECKFVFTREHMFEELRAIQDMYRQQGIDVDDLKRIGEELRPVA